MPRRVTPIVTGETYHVFNRGVDKRDVFLDTEDYLRFYNSLNFFNDANPCVSFFECARKAESQVQNLGRNLVHIHAYSLLPNHFHLLITQVSDGGISEFMKRVVGGYSSYFNDKNNRSGSLFQGRFKRVVIETNKQLLYVAAYVNYNHRVHSLGDPHEIYKTSKDVYSGKKESSFLSTDLILKQYVSVEAYKHDAEVLAEQIRHSRVSQNTSKRSRSTDELE